MKYFTFFFILILALTFSACSDNTATVANLNSPSPEVSETPKSHESPEVVQTPEVSQAPELSDVTVPILERDIKAEAEAMYLPIIEDTLDKLDDIRQDELSSVSTPFDSTYSYTAPREEDIETFGGDEEYIEEDKELFDAICALIIEHMPQDLSTYDKYRYLAMITTHATEYDLNYSEGTMSLTPYGAIMGGESICLGFTHLFHYLCEQADLWSTVVHGSALHNDEQHAWNLVMLEEGSYYVDVTWSDGFGQPGSGSWHRYFMVTEETLRRDHGAWDSVTATGTVNY